MRRLRFAPAALHDLQAISAYTRRAWGTAQAKSYARKLARDMKKLIQLPERFAVHEESGLGLRRMRSGRHKVFYRVNDEAVEIVRVLHERQDVSDEFE